MEKIRAAVVTEFGEPFEMRTFDRPKLKKGQVLVRITASGVCGSDVHIWKGLDPRVSTPLILGHEGVGVIEEIAGAKIDVFGRALEVGDAVIWDRGVVDNMCSYCTIHKTPSLCVNRWTYGISKTCDEPPYLNGCYAEAMVLRETTRILRLDGKSEPATLVPASCSGATSAHSFELHPPRIGETVLVQGPGPLGVFHIAFSKEHGASEIIVIGGTKDRLTLCRKFGATKLINRRETSVQERKAIIREWTEGRGVDVAYECSGTVQAFTEGLQHVRVGGAYVVPGFGVPTGEAKVDCFGLVTRKNVKIQGVWVSDTEHLYRAVKLVQSGKYPFSELVTHKLPLAEATEALHLVEKRETMKAVLSPD